jgi:serine palmitoyltransferase
MGMGFATNSQLIPAIVGPDDLVLSDSLNHASIVVGARSSASKIRLFEHNNIASLRAELSSAIATGNPRVNGQPWARIFILVEGMYSMEGESPPLREIVQVKKEFKAYLFVDEAHSIGALGASGRGVCEHYGVKPSDVDILMGTFTKSFGAVGGYVASSKGLIRQIRARSAGSLYSSAMSPPCARHVIWALRQIAGLDGTDIGRTRIQALRDNAIFFRRELAKLGVQTLGDWDSPVVPIMLYNPAKIAAFSRECLARGLAVVVVGFPATPLLLARARICLSAAHSHEDLIWALSVIDEVAEIIQIKYDRSLFERYVPTSVARLMGRKQSTECLVNYTGPEERRPTERDARAQI